MYKVLNLILILSVFGYVSTHSFKTNIQSSRIRRISTPLTPVNNDVDWCPTCVNSFDTLIYFVLDGISEMGIITSCNQICDYVTRKSESWIIGAVCSIGCDIVGVNEFIKIATEVDLDPIYFCEQLKFCPINDNGDAKFVAFLIAPPHGEPATTFILDLTYRTMNGTGTKKKSGIYAERISIDTIPDPDCESATYTCENWFSGVYNVTVSICNGECGSHHPHSQTYDTVKNSFTID